MDRKSVFILVICGILFAVWAVLTPRLYPPVAMAPITPAAEPGNGTTASTGSNTTAIGPAAVVAPGVVAGTNAAVSVVPAPGAAEETMVVTNGTTHYTFTSAGGALKLVEFDGAKYPESVARSGQKLSSNRPASLNRHSSQAMMALLNAQALQGDGNYKLTHGTRTLPPPTNAPASAPRVVEFVRAEKLLASQVRLVKEFELDTNYLIQARFRVENGSTQELKIPALEWSVGTAGPESPQDKGDLVGFAWHDGKSAKQFTSGWFDNKSLGCLPGTPRTEYHASAGGAAVHVNWAAIYSQFFFAAVMAQEAGNDIAGTRFHLPMPSPEEQAADRLAVTNQSAYVVSMTQPGTNIAAGASWQRDYTIFAGPKEYRVLEWLGLKYNNDLDSVMGYGGIFGFFSRILLLAMNLLHSIGLSYALAIILITVLLKVTFWPLTQASTRSMKRMQELAPQMNALKERYKAEPEKLQKKTWEFYRENKVNPMSGCLPMVVQIPVFIGFFTMVRSAIELRGATFLWATDLSRPDTIAVLSFLNFLPWPLTFLHNFPVNPLSIIMGVTMFFQTRLTPPSPGMDPAQQKMMKYLPLFFLFILYNYSAGLTLYWTVQNLLTMAQTKLTRTRDKKNGNGGAVAVRPVPVAVARRRR